ncbi:MAG: acetylxylan esterase [Gemmatales bacterium]
MRLLLLSVVCLLPSLILAGDPPSQVFSPSRLPNDGRLKPYHLDRPYAFTGDFASKEAWEKRAGQLRTQLLVSLGLFPMPEKTPLNAVVHGKIDKGDYTIEKVYFASMPGHYVCGNLYRPKNVKGKAPVVLNPHGHFTEGRFTKEPDNVVKRDLASHGEEFEEGARYPLQAAAVGLARLGCIVFHYDMVGYADTTQPIPHRVGFNALQAELRLQSFLGLQTWNSIRALDFVCDLPDVDTKRIGVTGASGGGTQTFLLCALDPRPTVAFPAVMVSANMQGGCICENASLLRVGTNNVEIAALFAPKPQAMTGANDWTHDIETRGLPELKKIYGLYGAADKVNAKHFSFPHNYNQVCREMFYEWFNKYFELGHSSPIKEQHFSPMSAKELSVFDADHPRPKDWLPAQRLQETMTAASDAQLVAMKKNDPKAFAALQRQALEAICGTSLPEAGTTKATQISFDQKEGYSVWKGTQTRKGTDDEVPILAIVPPKEKQTGVAVVWADAKGKAALFAEDGTLIPAVQKLVDSGAAVMGVDVFLTGEWNLPGKPTAIPMVPQKHHKDVPFLGYWLGYNRSIPAQRAHDLLTVISHLKQRKDVKEVWLIGTGEAGPWAGITAAFAGDQLSKVAVSEVNFDFRKINSPDDPMLLPGGLKYFGVYRIGSIVKPLHPVIAIQSDSTVDMVNALLTQR